MVIIMAKRKPKKVRIYDPVTGKYKIVNETPEIKRQIEQRRKEQAKQRRIQQQINAQKASEKKLQQLKKLNPGMYDTSIVRKGKIVKSDKWYDIESEKIRKNIADAVARDDQKRKARYEQKIKNLNKDYSIQEIKKAKQRGYTAINDINLLGRKFNTLIRTAPNGLQNAIINILGGKLLNEDSELTDFYNENYREVMLPNLIKEVNTIAEKIKMSLNVVKDYRTKLMEQRDNLQKTIKSINVEIESTEDDKTKKLYQSRLDLSIEQLQEIDNNLKISYDIQKGLEELLMYAYNTATHQEYRVNFSTTESEPKYTNDLYKSGL